MGVSAGLWEYSEFVYYFVYTVNACMSPCVSVSACVWWCILAMNACEILCIQCTSVNACAYSECMCACIVCVDVCIQ